MNKHGFSLRRCEAALKIVQDYESRDECLGLYAVKNDFSQGQTKKEINFIIQSKYKHIEKKPTMALLNLNSFHLYSD